MCTCEACHCNFDKNELVNNLCNECSEIINLLEPLGFIETKFNKKADYWIFTDDFNKFVPIIFDNEESEIYESLHCKELLEIQDTFLGLCEAASEAFKTLESLKLVTLNFKDEEFKDYDLEQFKFNYEKEFIREIARIKWFDKYKELMPFGAERYELFNNTGLKKMIEKDNQFLKANNLI